MEIRLIFSKEIVGLISLKNGVNSRHTKRLRFGEEKSRRRFFLPKSKPSLHFAEVQFAWIVANCWSLF